MAKIDQQRKRVRQQCDRACAAAVTASDALRLIIANLEYDKYRDSDASDCEIATQVVDTLNQAMADAVIALAATVRVADSIALALQAANNVKSAVCSV